MKSTLASLVLLTFFLQAAGQVNKSVMQSNLRFGLMGRWQTGNLEQFSILPNATFSLKNEKHLLELRTNYNYIKVGGFNAVNDLWQDVLYQYQPHKRLYLTVHAINGFAQSYRIDYSSLNGVGAGLNLIRNTAKKYLQIQLVGGYLNFDFEGLPAHSAVGLGSLIRSSFPLGKRITLVWEMSTYHSTQDHDFFGGGNFLQLDLAIAKGLSINIRHQTYYNHQKVELTENLNSMMLFGIQYQFTRTDNINN